MKLTSIYIHFLDVFNTDVSIKQLWLLIFLEIYFVTLSFFKNIAFIIFSKLCLSNKI